MTTPKTHEPGQGLSPDTPTFPQAVAQRPLMSRDPSRQSFRDVSAVQRRNTLRANSPARFNPVHAHRPLTTHVQIDQEFHLLSEAGFDMDRVHIRRNASMAQLYEDAIRNEGAVLSSTGALINFSGKKTGRSPKDKRIVAEETSQHEIWWGPVNIPCSEHVFEINRERAIDYLNTREDVYVVDAYAGSDPRYRLKVRVIASRAYHAAFMSNMLIMPTDQELQAYGDPDFTIYNAGEFPANRFTSGMTSSTSIEINFKRMEMVILGTEYAGEMKKGVFSVMHYLAPVKFGTLSIHSSCNEGDHNDVTLFFGLSGTGKTTLSADPQRRLIGDDEHVWTDHGVFNIEGGCYAKTIDLSESKEPDIFNAIRWGCILENVVYDETTRVCNYNDIDLTENTRAAYPLSHIPNHMPGGRTSHHPTNIVFLTCDAYGVLPPVSKLTSAQAQYHFVSGYTSKTPGTEEGVFEPIPTFSACYGQPFLVLHPGRYAALLADRMKRYKVDCWLVNTGWTGGKFGTGQRCPLKYTRAIVDAIHDGSLAQANFNNYDVFNLAIPDRVNGVPSEILDPKTAWTDQAALTHEVSKLASMFVESFRKYKSGLDEEILAAGPQLGMTNSS